MKFKVQFSQQNTGFTATHFTDPIAEGFATQFNNTTVITQQGKDGATFIPAVSDNGVLSWTNDKNLPNPEPVNIKGGDGYTPIKGVDYFDGINGKDGYTPIKNVDYFDGKDGRDGVDGRDGENGQDGYTPIKGVDYFDGINGKDGIDGRDGKDGYTPVKGIDYFDGAQGKDGKDGKDGQDGYTPIKGTDYFTEADKDELVEDVIASIEIPEAEPPSWEEITDKPDIPSIEGLATEEYVDNKDIFETDLLVVTAQGGIAAGSDLNGMTTHDILRKFLYPYVEPTLSSATGTPNGGTYEKGETKTITKVTITVTKKSEFITSIALYNGSTLLQEKTGDTVKNGGSFTFSNVNVVVPTDGNQLTVKVTDAAGKTYSKSTTSLTFVYPYYIGTCAAGATINEALVEGLATKLKESKGTKTNTFTVSNGHMVFAYPKAHGVLKSILDPNNFETISGYTRYEINITGLDGTTQAYYVYVSGATTVTSFKVTFKYS